MKNMTLWCVLVVMNSLLWMPVEAVELEAQRGKQSTPGTRATPEANPHDRGDRAFESDEYDATTQTPIHDVLNSEPALSAEFKHINIPYQVVYGRTRGKRAIHKMWRWRASMNIPEIMQNRSITYGVMVMSREYVRTKCVVFGVGFCMGRDLIMGIQKRA
ncbi:Hypothetical predicted protein [Xyrichtys novacula]|uniref:Uncharacterized protein n=1 Tax=Xyrichtys novacula TaxID=13765 RepID=A0AAV1FZE8_XYRNO|nr:Hypothetical predicted protein [Xyrichtys novacula]